MNEALKELEDTLADLAGRNLRLREENEELRAAIERVRAALDDADWGGPDRADVISEIRAALEGNDG